MMIRIRQIFLCLIVVGVTAAGSSTVLAHTTDTEPIAADTVRANPEIITPDPSRKPSQARLDAKGEVLVNRLNTLNGLFARRELFLAGRMTAIIEKITIRIAGIKENGTDTEEMETLLNTARQAIVDAEEFITVQQDKTYSIEVTEDSTARELLQAVLKEFKTDHMAIQEKLLDAREAMVVVVELFPKDSQE